MKRQIRGRLGLLLTTCSLLAAAGFVTACGGDDETTARTSASSASSANGGCTEPQQVKLPPVFPTAIWAPVLMARSEGFERQACVASTDAPGSWSTPAAMLAQLNAGRVDVTGLNAGQIAQAKLQGLDVKIIAPIAYANEDNGVYVKQDSPIRSLKDLAGKTIALGSLNNNVHAGIVEQLRGAGVDPSKVKFTLVPITETVTVIQSGRVDAAQVAEPFTTMNAGKIRPIIRDNLAPFGENSPFIYALTTGKLVRENPDLVKRYQQALCMSVQKAGTDAEAVRRAIVDAEMAPAEIAQEMTLPAFGTDFKRRSFDAMVQAMVRLGFLDGAPKAEEIFHDAEACQQAEGDAQ